MRIWQLWANLIGCIAGVALLANVPRFGVHSPAYGIISPIGYVLLGTLGTYSAWLLIRFTREDRKADQPAAAPTNTGGPDHA